MSKVKAVIRFIDGINRWVAGVTGLYRLDVWLWNRKAARLESLAAEVEAGGLPGPAERLRSAAALHRSCAAELAARWA